jgi:hypothetical protein
MKHFLLLVVFIVFASCSKEKIQPEHASENKAIATPASSSTSTSIDVAHGVLGIWKLEYYTNRYSLEDSSFLYSYPSNTIQFNTIQFFEDGTFMENDSTVCEPAPGYYLSQYIICKRTGNWEHVCSNIVEINVQSTMIERQLKLDNTWVTIQNTNNYIGTLNFWIAMYSSKDCLLDNNKKYLQVQCDHPNLLGARLKLSK